MTFLLLTAAPAPETVSDVEIKNRVRAFLEADLLFTQALAPWCTNFLATKEDGDWDVARIRAGWAELCRIADMAPMLSRDPHDLKALSDADLRRESTAAQQQLATLERQMGTIERTAKSAMAPAASGRALEGPALAAAKRKATWWAVVAITGASVLGALLGASQIYWAKHPSDSAAQAAPHLYP
jgi:hypothetical protein